MYNKEEIQYNLNIIDNFETYEIMSKVAHFLVYCIASYAHYYSCTIPIVLFIRD